MSPAFTADLFAWGDEPGSWHFVTLPAEVAEELRDLPVAPRGFGSVRVKVRVGGSTWSTSVFPDKQSGSFVLPVKQQVRRAEDLVAGDPVAVWLEPEGAEG